MLFPYALIELHLYYLGFGFGNTEKRLQGKESFPPESSYGNVEAFCG